APARPRGAPPRHRRGPGQGAEQGAGDRAPPLITADGDAEPGGPASPSGRRSCPPLLLPLSSRFRPRRKPPRPSVDPLFSTALASGCRRHLLPFAWRPSRASAPRRAAACPPPTGAARRRARHVSEQRTEDLTALIHA